MASINLLNCPLFTPRFVPHRLVWKHDDDVCYECIDRNAYTSVVVRLRRFETDNIEQYKAHVARAQAEAVVHPNLSNLVEIIVDEANKITITVSENPRGMTFKKFVEAVGRDPSFNGMIQEILLAILSLFKTLNETNKDLSAVPLGQMVIGLDSDNKLETIKVRRPFLTAKSDRSRAFPYNRYQNSNPCFIDLASIAYFAFTQKDLFEYEDFGLALDQLSPEEQAFITKLFSVSHNFDIVETLIQKMFTPESVEIISPSDCEGSDTSSFGVCSDDEVKSSDIDDGEYDIVNNSVPTAIELVNNVQTAVGHDDDEVNTAIGDDDDETKTAIEPDDDDEVRTAVGNDDDETKTAIEDDEVRTAIDETEEIGTALEDDVQTAVGDDEDVAIEIVNDEMPVAKYDFGLQIPNLDKVFKYCPDFHIRDASLNVEGNTLVYTSAFSSVTYRKLTVYCEDGEVTKVDYETCYGSQLRGKCENTVTYKHFGDMSPDAKYCLMEVYIAVANTLSNYHMFVFKNYGNLGLTVKFMLDGQIHCTMDDQYYSYNSNGEEFASSEIVDKMPSYDVLQKIVADCSKVAQCLRETSPNKKFTINFTEE